MEDKFTQGPWKDSRNGLSGNRRVVGDGKQLVALVYGKDSESREANARLIIAAPELLRACREARDIIAAVKMADDDPDGTGIAAYVNMMDRAINKAEGR